MLRYISERAQLLRAYSTGIGKPAVIYPTAFLYSVGVGEVLLGLVFYTRDVFHATPATVGWLSASWSLSYVFGCMVVRPLFNRVIPRYLITGSLLATFLLSASMLFAANLRVLLALQLSSGLSMSLFWPPMVGWISAGVEGAVLSRLISRFNRSWCLGAIISPYVCGWLAEIDPRLPLVSGSLLILVAAAYVAGAAAVLPKIREEPPTGAGEAAREGGGDRDTPLRFPAWVGLFAMFFGLGIVGSIFPLAARDEMSAPESLIGLLLAIRAMSNFATFGVMGHTTFWQFRAGPMMAAPLAGVAIFLLLAATRSAWVIGALFALYGVAVGMSYSASLFHGLSGNADRRGRMAAHESVLALGLVAGAGLGGGMYQATSFAGTCWLGAAVLCAGFAGQALLCRRIARTEASSQAAEAPANPRVS